MNPITLQQMSELSDKEQRQLKACTNEFLGRQYAAQQRRKRIAKARRKLEESEDDYEHSTD